MSLFLQMNEPLAITSWLEFCWTKTSREFCLWWTTGEIHWYGFLWLCCACSGSCRVYLLVPESVSLSLRYCGSFRRNDLRTKEHVIILHTSRMRRMFRGGNMLTKPQIEGIADGCIWRNLCVILFLHPPFVFSRMTVSVYRISVLKTMAWTYSGLVT